MTWAWKLFIWFLVSLLFCVGLLVLYGCISGPLAATALGVAIAQAFLAGAYGMAALVAKMDGE